MGFHDCRAPALSNVVQGQCASSPYLDGAIQEALAANLAGIKCIYWRFYWILDLKILPFGDFVE